MTEENKEGMPVPPETAEEERTVPPVPEEERAEDTETEDAEAALDPVEDAQEEDGAEEDDGLGVLFEIPQDEILVDAKPGTAEEILSPEEHREHALSVAEMAGRMIRYEYQDRYYRKAIRELKPLFEEIPETLKEYKRYRRKMHNARAKYRIASYQEACALRDAASTEEEFQRAAEKFEAIAKYDSKHHLNEKFCKKSLYEKASLCEDTPEQAAWCRRQQEKLAGRRQKRVTGVLIALAALVVALLLSSHTSWYLYAKGRAEELAGMPGKAWQAYYESYKITRDPGTYEKYQAARYREVVQGLKSGEGSEVQESLQELSKKDYKDARQLLLNWEVEQVAAAAPGDAVDFGGESWRVLDQDGSKRLLIRGSAIDKIPFQADGSACTWETSSIRAYLNEEWPDVQFTPEERALLLEETHPAEDNRLTGISGGNDTTDLVFLLSTSEAEQYVELIPETKRCWWLRTPGTEPGTMSFVNTDRTIMDAGYEVASDGIRVKPAIWVETEIQQP